MKVRTGLHVGMLVTLMGVVGSCAHTGPDPCIGTYEERLTMSCVCPGTLDPACVPFPSDAKRPTTDGGTTP